MILKSKCISVGCEYFKKAHKGVSVYPHLNGRDIPDICRYDDLPLKRMRECPLKKFNP